MSGLSASPEIMAEDLVRHFEGLRLDPYQDTALVWTVGFGTTEIDGKPVTERTAPITLDQAEEYLAGDLNYACIAVDEFVTVPLAPHEFAALVSFTYNLGSHALATSTLRKLLNQGKRAASADQFGQWVYAGGKRCDGLVTRRALERDVFLGLAPIPT